MKRSNILKLTIKYIDQKNVDEKFEEKLLKFLEKEGYREDNKDLSIEKKGRLRKVINGKDVIEKTQDVIRKWNFVIDLT